MSRRLLFILGGVVLLFLEITRIQRLAVFADKRFDRMTVHIENVADALFGAAGLAMLVIKRHLLLLAEGVLFAGAIELRLMRFHTAQQCGDIRKRRSRLYRHGRGPRGNDRERECDRNSGERMQGFENMLEHLCRLYTVGEVLYRNLTP